jgi:type IV secretory pathway VirB10-like protein
MISKVLALGLVGAGCVVVGGAYVAVRDPGPSQPAAVVAPVAQPQAAEPQSAKPVSETEAIVSQKPAAPVAAAERVERAPKPVERPRAGRPAAEPSRRAPQPAVTSPAPVSRPSTVPTGSERPPAPVEPPPPPVAVPESTPEPTRPAEPAPVEPQFEEVIVPASSVIGLQVTTALSSERTQVEDRVEARVTRDVISAGRVAIPEGSRVLGSVTLVERGGKVKERARLGVRFHTLILADGSEVSLRTEGIFRDGQSPSGESARKIGGAAIGGAILGAILGGGKGAVVGGATGAAGGTAAVMSGDRNAATLPSGTVVTVRLTAPLTVELRKEKAQ